MSEPTLAGLLAWNRAEDLRWHAWFAARPAALDVSMGSGAGTVRRTILHTFTVDLRYGQRLVGLPVSAVDHVEAPDLDALFALAGRGNALLSGWLAAATPADLDRQYTFVTLSAGELVGTARKILLHSCTHHLRHWAQIATVLRIAGHKSDWYHDLMASDAMR